mgnify:CR=1 FL=1
MATKIAEQLTTLTRTISPLRQPLDFECRESLDQITRQTAVFRRGVDRRDMHASVAHDLHMSGPEGAAWPPIRSRT